MWLKRLPPVVHSPARTQGKVPSLSSSSVPLQELQHCLARVPEGLAEREDVLSLSCYLPLLHNEPCPVGVMLNEVMEGERGQQTPTPRLLCCHLTLHHSLSNNIQGFHNHRGNNIVLLPKKGTNCVT